VGKIFQKEEVNQRNYQLRKSLFDRGQTKKKKKVTLKRGKGRGGKSKVKRNAFSSS